MTSKIRTRFLAGLGALALAGGVSAAALTATSASASVAGGNPSPSPSPSMSTTTPPPPEHPKQEQPVCQYITLTGFGAQTGHGKQGEGKDPAGYNAPMGGTNDHGNNGAEVIVVDQTVKFCELGERTWTTDVTPPHAVEGVVESAHGHGD
jgi:hypothetical protein